MLPHQVMKALVSSKKIIGRCPLRLFQTHPACAQAIFLSNQLLQFINVIRVKV